MISVFISYAREDQDFARKMCDALRAAGDQVSWDQDHEAVPFSAPWRSEIRSLIDKNEKFVYVLSPDSLESRECANELAHAIEVHKHIIPIKRRSPRDGQVIPQSIEEVNWIDFTSDVSFDISLEYLTAALNTDLSWAKAHTRLLTRSIEWAAGSRDRSLLLRGSDLRTAEEWISRSGDHPQTLPTPTQREYITASRHATERATRFSRGALALGLVVAVSLATVAIVQRNQARHEANVAQARALAAEATAELAIDPARSLRLALESTRQNASSTGVQALRLALAADKDRMAFQPGFGAGTQATWSPAGDVIAATGSGNRVQLWDPRTGRLIRLLGPLRGTDPISELTYNGQGDLLAAVTKSPQDLAGGHVALWNTQTGSTIVLPQVNKYIRTHRKDRGSFNPLAATWDPQNGDLFIYGADLRGALVYIPSIRKVLTLFPGSYVSNLRFAQSGSSVYVQTNRNSIADNAQIMTFKNDSFTLAATLAVPSDWATDHSSCWIPGTNEIATWDPNGAQDDTLRIFSTRTGAQLFLRVGNYTAAACGNSRSAGPYVVAGDKSGNSILVRTGDFFVTGVRREFTVLSLYGHTQTITSVAASDDGAYMATAADDGTVRIWNSANGRQLSVISAGAQPFESVQFNADGGAVLAVEEDGVVRVADAGVGEPDVRLSQPSGGRTYALGFAAGSRLVYGLNEVTRSAQALRKVQWLLPSCGARRLAQ